MKATMEATHEVYNPANPDELVGRIRLNTSEEVVEAILAAEEAFHEWKSFSPVERGKILEKAADLVEDNIRLLADAASREMGKTVKEMEGEVKRGAAILRYFAQEGLRATGEVLPSASPTNMLYTKRVPLGVVAAITPWNFPIAIPLWKIAPALVHGNTVVWKPSIEAGLTGGLLSGLFLRAGMPKNVLNVVQGRGSVIGNILTGAAEVKAITFTGSNAVGKHILRSVGQGKKVQLELGGKNAAIILADADLDLAARLTMEGAMKQTGQRCTATSRVYIEEAVYDEVLERLIAEAAKIELGVNMGPVASRNRYEEVLSAIELAKREEATLVYGGGPAQDMGAGYFIEPTIFTDVTHDMAIAREEIFGPVLAVIKVKDYEEALELANDSEYGLSASLFTNNLQLAFDFSERCEVGLVNINNETGGAEPQAPFGGMKNSGYGPREQGQAAKEFFTTTKTITIGRPK